MMFFNGKPVSGVTSLSSTFTPTPPDPDPPRTEWINVGRGATSVSGTIRFSWEDDATYAFMRSLYPSPEALEGV